MAAGKVKLSVADTEEAQVELALNLIVGGGIPELKEENPKEDD